MCVCMSILCVSILTLFVTQTGDVSDHYPIEFELLGKMNRNI